MVNVLGVWCNDRDELAGHCRVVGKHEVNVTQSANDGKERFARAAVRCHWMCNRHSRDGDLSHMADICRAAPQIKRKL